MQVSVCMFQMEPVQISPSVTLAGVLRVLEVVPTLLSEICRNAKIPPYIMDQIHVDYRSYGLNSVVKVALVLNFMHTTSMSYNILVPSLTASGRSDIASKLATYLATGVSGNTSPIPPTDCREKARNLHMVAHEWFLIGIKANVPVNTLLSIANEKMTCADRMRSILNRATKLGRVDELISAAIEYGMCCSCL